jgi:hypothetical protein
MADNTLPEGDLSAPSSSIEDVKDDERRKFLRRAAIAGLPVVLATVRGRTVFAGGQTASCAGSVRASKVCQ